MDINKAIILLQKIIYRHKEKEPEWSEELEGAYDEWETEMMALEDDMWKLRDAKSVIDSLH